MQTKKDHSDGDRSVENPMSYSSRLIEGGEALYALLYLLLKSNVELAWWLVSSALDAVQTPKSFTKDELRTAHKEDKEKLLEEFHEKRHGGRLALGGKTVSYLFRPRKQPSTKLTTLGHFKNILEIDSVSKIAHVGGMITFYDLVKETLKQGLLPEVVPELRGITVGGSVAGLAVESSSFKYGLVHEAVTEMEVLTGEGAILTCRRDNENSSLFYGMPNSYGTLGYAISAKLKLVSASPFVKLEHSKFDNLNEYFQAMEQSCKHPELYNFIDGAIFSPNLMVMTKATFAESAPYTSNYRQQGIYYKSIQEKDVDYLTTSDYIWRWDADSFWSTEGTVIQHPYVRQLFGDVMLRSDRLKMLGNFAGQMHKNVQKINSALFGSWPQKYRESIIQDVGIPIENCASFVSWLDEHIGIYPLFVCPTQSPNPENKYPLWDLHQGSLACDIGIFGSRSVVAKTEKGHLNRQIEDAVEQSGGKKSLYSQSFFKENTFEKLYCNNGYHDLKKNYDPHNYFPSLYQKTVLNH